MAKRKLEPDPRASNGQAKHSGHDKPAVGLNSVKETESRGKDSKCSCHHSPAVEKKTEGDVEPPLHLTGTRTKPSALLKLQGSVHCAWNRNVPVQPMVDSGASGMGFVDPAFIQRCGVQVRPSTRRVVLADGREVAAAGEATLTYSLSAFTCARKKATSPVQLTSTFIVTPLAPYELILGIGWLEQHDVHTGWRERNIQLRVDGVGKQHFIRPLERCNDDGSAAATAATSAAQR